MASSKKRKARNSVSHVVAVQHVPVKTTRGTVFKKIAHTAISNEPETPRPRKRIRGLFTPSQGAHAGEGGVIDVDPPLPAFTLPKQSTTTGKVRSQSVQRPSD